MNSLVINHKFKAGDIVITTASTIAEIIQIDKINFSTDGSYTVCYLCRYAVAGGHQIKALDEQCLHFPQDFMEENNIKISAKNFTLTKKEK